MNRRNIIAALVVIVGGGPALPLAAQRSLGDLPLTMLPAPAGPLLAVVLSGDGGWAGGDKSVARAFVADSVAVVGLSSPRYLERQRTPDEAAGDLARIILHFSSTWTRERTIVVGYSRGADIGPFMVSRLPAQVRNHVAMLVLLGPGKQASFKFSMLDLARSHHGNDSLPVAPEVAKLRDVPVLCFYGATDRGAICPALAQAGTARALQRKGGHVVHGDEGPALVQEILAELRSRDLERNGGRHTLNQSAP